MPKFLKKRHFAVHFFIFIFTGCSVLVSPDEAYFSEPGERLVSKEISVEKQAARDVVFAWLSEAAYPGQVPENPGACPAAELALQEHGWKQLTMFSQEEILFFERTGLRFKIWQHAQPPRVVVVSFAGTDLSSWAHFQANIRWVFKSKQDTYSDVINEFSPRFNLRYEEKVIAGIIQPETSLYATGHSLGGGLAQVFSFSLPESKLTPRVKRVFVFNTTPVTGKADVPRQRVKKNTCGMTIDRIYQSSDPLDAIRTLSAAIYRASEANPATRQVRYNVAPFLAFSDFHSIRSLACGLAKKAEHSQIDASLLSLEEEKRLASTC